MPYQCEHLGKETLINDMTAMTGNKMCVVVGHVTEVYGPVQALAGYLMRRKKDFIYITIPFCYCSLPRAQATVVRSGVATEDITGPRNPSMKKMYGLYYVCGAFFTLMQIVKRRKSIGLYVGIDNLNAFLGLILKKLGYVDTVAYYVIDYTKVRFLFKPFNYLYHVIDRICVKHADSIWNISERIAEVRKSQGVPSPKNLVVPVGVELDKIRMCQDGEVDRNILVAVSHLTESKGVQLVIDVIADVKGLLPDIKLHIIGTGPYEAALKRMAKEKGVEEIVTFKGSMAHDNLFCYLPKCGVALATYTENPDNITYYADPTKPKEYLACGLPVIITKVPWIAELIDRKPMGIAINYNKEDLKQAICKLMKDQDFYVLCRRNALSFASALSWDSIYDEALTAIFAVH